MTAYEKAEKAAYEKIMTLYEKAGLWSEISLTAYKIENAAKEQDLDKLRELVSKLNEKVNVLVAE